MGSKVTMPAAPAAPTPVDPGQSALDFTRAMADPVLQGQILQSEQMYRPQYADLNLADMNTYMSGSATQKGFLDLTDEATQRANTLASNQLSQQRAADIGDVEALGGQAGAAFMNANPALRAQMERAQGLSDSQNPIQIDQGGLGQNLYGQAMGAQTANLQGLGAAGQQLDARAQQLAQSTGRLTPTELRQLEQSSRAGYASRGREMGAGSVAGEAFARYANERQNMQQDLGLAAQLNQGSQQEIGANRAYYLQDQGANRAFQGQVYNADLARQQANQAAQQNRTGQDRSYALALAQMQQGVASDPFMTILGRPSQSQQAGMASAQFASGLAGQNMGPMLFDPNAGINLAMQNNANQSNYQSSIFGAQAGFAGAQAQARGAMIGGLASGLGALGGGFASKGCWVAREVYGIDNPKWLRFREWMLHDSPAPFRYLYLRYGERFAAFISNKPKLKNLIRKWMDKRIENAPHKTPQHIIEAFHRQRGTF
jgi:hypothetical protein